MADQAVVEGAAVVVKALMASTPVGSSNNWACCCSAATRGGVAARPVCAKESWSMETGMASVGAVGWSVGVAVDG